MLLKVWALPKFFKTYLIDIGEVLFWSNIVFLLLSLVSNPVGACLLDVVFALERFFESGLVERYGCFCHCSWTREALERGPTEQTFSCVSNLGVVKIGRIL